MARIYNIYRCGLCGWVRESLVMRRYFCLCGCKQPMGYCGTVER